MDMKTKANRISSLFKELSFQNIGTLCLFHDSLFCLCRVTKCPGLFWNLLVLMMRPVTSKLLRNQWVRTERKGKGSQEQNPIQVSCNSFLILCFFPHNFLDLSLILENLHKKSYNQLVGFVADVSKIFNNCRLYNPRDSSFYRCAEVVESFFVQKLNTFKNGKH